MRWKKGPRKGRGGGEEDVGSYFWGVDTTGNCLCLHPLLSPPHPAAVCITSVTLQDHRNVKGVRQLPLNKDTSPSAPRSCFHTNPPTAISLRWISTLNYSALPWVLRRSLVSNKQEISSPGVKPVRISALTRSWWCDPVKLNLNKLLRCHLLRAGGASRAATTERHGCEATDEKNQHLWSLEQFGGLFVQLKGRIKIFS